MPTTGLCREGESKLVLEAIGFAFGYVAPSFGLIKLGLRGEVLVLKNQELLLIEHHRGSLRFALSDVLWVEGFAHRCEEVEATSGGLAAVGVRET
jgi:hypothetical protein